MTGIFFQVLRHLADGEFHSGAALARALGVSRGTIWNAVRSIDAAGLAVHRVRGRGYRLAEALSMLDRRAIEHHVGSHASRFSLEILDGVASTNSALLAQVSSGAPDGHVIAAECQHSGRGRRGRAWHTGFGGALTFSVLWRFAEGAGALAGLTLAVGVAIVRALQILGASEIGLKWPNDVLWRGRKLAGILAEMHGDALGPSAVVIGIGLNVRLSEALRARIDQPAADLEAACGRTLDRNRVLGVVLAELACVLDTFSEKGFAPFRDEWQQYHAHQGAIVFVTLPDGCVERGRAHGIAEDGALLFQSGESVRRLHSGEISLRAVSATPSVSRIHRDHERSAQ